MTNRNLNRSVLVVTLSASFLLYYAVLTPERFGVYHDDSIYATTAKALATGQGYRIISLPHEPAQTKYPPLYAFLLSMIWRANSQFPQNITWMMMVSVLVTLIFLALTYRYLTNRGYATQLQALIVVGLAAINWRTIVLATGIYSEMLYAALSVIALHLAERDANKNGNRFRTLALGIVVGLAFLTRSSGLALLGAVGLYYAVRKQWGRAVSVLGIGGLFVLGWIGWCYASNTGDGGINAPYYTSYLSHLSQSVNDLQAQGNSSALMVYLNIILTNIIGGILISVPVVCSAFSYSWTPSFSGSSLISICSLILVFLVLLAGFLRHGARGIRLIHVYIVSCFALYVFWLPGVAYDRFIMPLLPFLLFFIVAEINVLLSAAREKLRSGTAILGKLSAVLIGLTLLTVISVNLFNYGSGVYRSLTSVKKAADRAYEDSEAITWIKENSDPSEALACYRDPKFFLYTGHKAVRSFPMTEGYSWEEDDVSMDKLAQSVFRIIDESAVRYVVSTSSDFELEDRSEQHRKTFNKLIERHPQNFVLVFESAGLGSRIYQVVKTAR